MFVDLYHPDLDTSIQVNESAVRIHLKNGWTTPEETVPEEPVEEPTNDLLETPFQPTLKE